MERREKSLLELGRFIVFCDTCIGEVVCGRRHSVGAGGDQRFTAKTIRRTIRIVREGSE